VNRPICWICGKHLQSVRGVPVYVTWVDPIGIGHKVHKWCDKAERREAGGDRRKAMNERFKEWE